MSGRRWDEPWLSPWLPCECGCPSANVHARRWLLALAAYLSRLSRTSQFGRDEVPEWNMRHWRSTWFDEAGAPCRTAACAIGHGWIGGVLPPGLSVRGGDRTASVPGQRSVDLGDVYFEEHPIPDGWEIAEAYRLPAAVAIDLFVVGSDREVSPEMMVTKLRAYARSLAP